MFRLKKFYILIFFLLLSTSLNLAQDSLVECYDVDIEDIPFLLLPSKFCYYLEYNLNKVWFNTDKEYSIEEEQCSCNADCHDQECLITLSSQNCPACDPSILNSKTYYFSKPKSESKKISTLKSSEHCSQYPDKESCEQAGCKAEYQTQKSGGGLPAAANNNKFPLHSKRDSF